MRDMKLKEDHKNKIVCDINGCGNYAKYIFCSQSGGAGSEMRFCTECMKQLYMQLREVYSEKKKQ